MFLKDDTPNVAQAALHSLREFVEYNNAYADRTGRLLLTYLDHSDIGVRANALYAISEICAHSPSLALPLLDHAERFAHSTDVEMRIAAPYVLPNIFKAEPQKTYHRIVTLLKKLSFDTETNTRRNVAEATGKILSHNARRDDTLAQILDILLKDNHTYVRSAAENALDLYMRQLRLTALQNAMPVVGDIEKQMPAAMTDTTLAQAVMNDAILLLTTPDTAIQQRIIDAVGRLGAAHESLAPQAIDALTAMKDADHPPARLFAVQNIGTIGAAHGAQAEAAIKALSAFNADTDESVISRTLAAATIIGKRHHAATDDARDLLTPFTKSKDTTLRRTTEHQLKMLPPAP